MKKTKENRLSSFDWKVFKVVSEIPLGEVKTYKWVAKRINHPESARAVGNSLKKNPWPVVIPCHRVIHSDSSLGGYSQGKRMKKKLLDLERKIKDLML
ncbi:MAG: MGMT family protein [Candidatus Gygaella obscura]|nr:MGMT family protein [Candidatus Gygaella obscura]